MNLKLYWIIFIIILIFPFSLFAQNATDIKRIGLINSQNRGIYSTVANPAGLAGTRNWTTMAGLHSPFGINDLNSYFLSGATGIGKASAGLSVRSSGTAQFRNSSAGLTLAHQVGEIAIGGRGGVSQLSVDGKGTRFSWEFAFGGIYSITKNIEISAYASNPTVPEFDFETAIPAESRMEFALAYKPARNLTFGAAVFRENSFGKFETGYTFETLYKWQGKAYAYLGKNTLRDTLGGGFGISVMGQEFHYGTTHHTSLGFSHSLFIVINLKRKSLRNE
ncbi:hypothetical protein FUAX_25660 [Fulvitalea axinellae]|uniref:Type IX secretion system membrane protein PorP/SprF n=1 Tax=Fulvitalea axinellae TaxID=1182444 RepID=A0AAU9CUJ3_9BACT|nr:hypothetical protein FUAX_25660 [Fulvitalea axinellae]